MADTHNVYQPLIGTGAEEQAVESSNMDSRRDANAMAGRAQRERAA
ncbi:MAG TPA: hypothetical protein VMW56_16750 [Candidatus Margulisiibacteriota bacterium]|nr:hypothetical protein [Candidatus Margulisiibacteriota bacterium]